MIFIDFIIFTLRSSLEYIAMLILIFSIFRIQFRYFTYHMIFVCLSLSYVSYTMRIDGLSTITPIVQLFILIIFMWLLFQFQIFYAAIMSVTGYFLYAAIQIIIVFTAQLLNLITLEDLKPLAVETSIIAILSGVVTLIISLYIRKKNWGFAFVPHSDSIKVNYRKKENMTLLIVMIFSLFGFSFAYYFTLVSTNPAIFFVNIILLICLVSIFLYISIKKDKDEDDD